MSNYEQATITWTCKCGNSELITPTALRFKKVCRKCKLAREKKQNRERKERAKV